MKKFILLIFILAGCSSKQVEDLKYIDPNVLNQHIQRSMEYAYFEGQKDALGGTIRIDSIQDQAGSYKYVWTKSPWDQGKQPIYVPGTPLN